MSENSSISSNSSNNNSDVMMENEVEVEDETDVLHTKFEALCFHVINSLDCSFQLNELVSGLNHKQKIFFN